MTELGDWSVESHLAGCLDGPNIGGEAVAVHPLKWDPTGDEEDDDGCP